MDFGRTTVHKHCLLSLLEKRRGVAENKKVFRGFQTDFDLKAFDCLFHHLLVIARLLKLEALKLTKIFQKTEIFQKDLKEQKSMNSKVHWMKFSL